MRLPSRRCALARANIIRANLPSDRVAGTGEEGARSPQSVNLILKRMWYGGGWSGGIFGARLAGEEVAPQGIALPGHAAVPAPLGAAGGSYCNEAECPEGKEARFVKRLGA